MQRPQRMHLEGSRAMNGWLSSIGWVATSPRNRFATASYSVACSFSAQSFTSWHPHSRHRAASWAACAAGRVDSISMKPFARGAGARTAARARGARGVSA